MITNQKRYAELRQMSIQELETERSSLYEDMEREEADPYGGWGSCLHDSLSLEVSIVEDVLDEIFVRSGRKKESQYNQ
jgi:hypothetical protein